MFLPLNFQMPNDYMERNKIYQPEEKKTFSNSGRYRVREIQYLSLPTIRFSN